ncbi:TnsD family Tn7-like transposition protein [Nitrospira sp. Nam74]
MSLVRQTRGIASPIHHLILIRYLGYTAARFFEALEQPSHFGSGPSPCLNRAASHFHDTVISECHIEMSSNEGKPVGICVPVRLHIQSRWT